MITETQIQQLISLLEQARIFFVTEDSKLSADIDNLLDDLKDE